MEGRVQGGKLRAHMRMVTEQVTVTYACAVLDHRCTEIALRAKKLVAIRVQKRESSQISAFSHHCLPCASCSCWNASLLCPRAKG